MSEQHPYFPSGIWDGFYLYFSGPNSTRHEMHFNLNFTAGRVTGSGSDSIGAFSWEGTYDANTFACNMVKRYATHPVFYRGMADESGIYGQWSIRPTLTGGFHIWPRKGNEEESAVEEEVASQSLTFTAP